MAEKKDDERGALDDGREPTTPPPKPSDAARSVKPAMSEVEIRAAGLAVDVPFETGDGSERLSYEDLGPDKKWEGELPTSGAAKTTDDLDSDESAKPGESAPSADA